MAGSMTKEPPSISIAGGGLLGGLLLSGFGASSLACGTLTLTVAAVIIVVIARRLAFPA